MSVWSRRAAVAHRAVATTPIVVIPATMATGVVVVVVVGTRHQHQHQHHRPQCHHRRRHRRRRRRRRRCRHHRCATNARLSQRLWVPMADPTPRVGGGVPRRPAATAAPSAPPLQCCHRPPASALGSGKEDRRHAAKGAGVRTDVGTRTNDRVMQRVEVSLEIDSNDRDFPPRSRAGPALTGKITTQKTPSTPAGSMVGNAEVVMAKSIAGRGASM